MLQLDFHVQVILEQLIYHSLHLKDVLQMCVLVYVEIYFYLFVFLMLHF